MDPALPPCKFKQSRRVDGRKAGQRDGRKAFGSHKLDECSAAEAGCERTVIEGVREGPGGEAGASTAAHLNLSEGSVWWAQQRRRWQLRA